MSQIWDGNPLTSYAVVFLEAAGFNEIQTFDINISISACFVIGVLICYGIFPFFGRKTIYLSGLSAMFCILVTVRSSRLVIYCLKIQQRSSNFGLETDAIGFSPDRRTWIQPHPQFQTRDRYFVGDMYSGQHHLYGTDVLSHRGRNPLGTFEIQNHRNWKIRLQRGKRDPEYDYTTHAIFNV